MSFLLNRKARDRFINLFHDLNCFFEGYDDFLIVQNILTRSGHTGAVVEGDA